MKIRLAILYFLQFGVWGCYLTSIGQFLGSAGLGAYISWFYAAIGIVSILTPPLFGRLADKSISPHRLLSFSHLIAAILMTGLWVYTISYPQPGFTITYLLYAGFLAFYMPTMALANTVTFRLLENTGHDTITSFPSIRIWGTVGFIAAMWLVNSAYWDDGSLHFTLSDSSDHAHLRFQYNAMQLLCSGLVGFIAGFYSLTLPRLSGSQRIIASTRKTQSNLFLNATSLFSIREIRLFLIFVILSGVCLQISNGFVTPYITQFMASPEYAGSLAAGNATMLFSISQISEALCIFLVGICMKRTGIRWVYAIGLLAWCLRFMFLGLGNPDKGVSLLIGSMIIYGIAFNFITIAGHLHIQQIAPTKMKGFAQGIMMLMSNGIGATSGILIAGSIVNHWCHWEIVSVGDSSLRLFTGEWIIPWSIFAGYAFLIAIAWITIYRTKGQSSSINS
ncbi:MAG: MFS transporter [Muribaculaceae bacterium]|nr:MFS transporter [Muribaculaceae bacterium]